MPDKKEKFLENNAASENIKKASKQLNICRIPISISTTRPVLMRLGKMVNAWRIYVRGVM
jgi:hypothetical protein